MGHPVDDLLDCSLRFQSQEVFGLLPDAPAAPPLLQARREAALQRVDIHKGIENTLSQSLYAPNNI